MDTCPLPIFVSNGPVTNKHIIIKLNISIIMAHVYIFGRGAVKNVSCNAVAYK